MALLPREIAEAYVTLMERAMLRLRMRIRYGEQVSLNEIHDLLDALHNIPPMLRGDGEWFTEEHIGADLARYDQRWMDQPGSEHRESLVRILETTRLEL